MYITLYTNNQKFFDVLKSLSGENVTAGRSKKVKFQ